MENLTCYGQSQTSCGVWVVSAKPVGDLLTVARGSGGFERRQKFEMREDSVGMEEEASLCVGLVSAALVVLPLAEGCSMLQSWQTGGVTNVNESRKTCRYMAAAEVNV